MTLNGSVVVDQEAPPPGGHTDLTINRDVMGRWNTAVGAIGETGPGTPGHAEFGAYGRAVGLPGLLYDHEHRFERATPEYRTIHFAERGRDRHERFTWMRKTLADIAAAQPRRARLRPVPEPAEPRAGALPHDHAHGRGLRRRGRERLRALREDRRHVRLADLPAGRPRQPRRGRAEPAPARPPHRRRCARRARSGRSGRRPAPAGRCASATSRTATARSPSRSCAPRTTGRSTRRRSTGTRRSPTRSQFLEEVAADDAWRQDDPPRQRLWRVAALRQGRRADVHGQRPSAGSRAASGSARTRSSTSARSSSTGSRRRARRSAGVPDDPRRGPSTPRRPRAGRLQPRSARGTRPTRGLDCALQLDEPAQTPASSSERPERSGQRPHDRTRARRTRRDVEASATAGGLHATRRAMMARRVPQAEVRARRRAAARRRAKKSASPSVSAASRRHARLPSGGAPRADMATQPSGERSRRRAARSRCRARTAPSGRKPVPRPRPSPDAACRRAPRPSSPGRAGTPRARRRSGTSIGNAAADG